MKFIKTEQLKIYNANDRGHDTNDCVKRALSLTLNISYKDIEKELHEEQKKQGAYAWNIKSVYEAVLKKHCNYDIDTEHTGITVLEFSEKCSTGIYAVLCGKSESKSSHIVAVMNGDVYDSWDCSSWIVNKIYKIKDISSEQINQLTENDISELQDLAYQTAEDVALSYANKNKLNPESITITKKKTDNLTSMKLGLYYSIDCEHQTYISDSILKDIVYTFSPRMTMEECKKYTVEQTTNGMNKFVTDVKWRENEIKKENTYSEYDGHFSGSTEELNILRKLPAWCRRMFCDIEYRKFDDDKYRGTMLAFKTDPNYNEKDPYVYFRAATLDEFKNNIEDYRKHYWRVDYDY